MQCLRGEVWVAYVGAVQGGESAGTRRVLVVSSDDFNEGPLGLASIVPLTTSDTAIDSHVRVTSPEGGVKKESFVMCEHIRSIHRRHLIKRCGVLRTRTMTQVDAWLTDILDL